MKGLIVAVIVAVAVSVGCAGRQVNAEQCTAAVMQCAANIVTDCMPEPEEEPSE